MYNSQEENTNSCPLKITAKKHPIVRVFPVVGGRKITQTKNKHSHLHHKTPDSCKKKKKKNILWNTAIKKAAKNLDELPHLCQSSFHF